jgi:hypothetical protein
MKWWGGHFARQAGRQLDKQTKPNPTGDWRDLLYKESDDIGIVRDQERHWKRWVGEIVVSYPNHIQSSYSTQYLRSKIQSPKYENFIISPSCHIRISCTIRFVD